MLNRRTTFARSPYTQKVMFLTSQKFESKSAGETRGRVFPAR